MLRGRVRGQEENVDINRRKTEQFFGIRQDITVIETLNTHTRGLERTARRTLMT